MSKSRCSSALILCVVVQLGFLFIGSKGSIAGEYFSFDGDRYEIKAEQVHPNSLFQEMEEALRIPIGRLPENTPLVTVHSRSRDIEKILSSFCDSYVVQYGEHADGRVFLEEVEVTISLDTIKQDYIFRQKTIRNNGLSQKMRLPTHLDFEYAGIGAYIQPADDGASLWVRPLGAETPSAKAGIKLGDQIVAIDGRPVFEFESLAAAVAAIRGPVGTPVQLVIVHPDSTRVNQVVMRALVDARTPAKRR